MSTMRTAEIRGLLERWLERYSPPRSLDGNARAQQDEAQALLGVLSRFAPQVDYADFCGRAFLQMDYQMKTRAWPTTGEFGAVCSKLRKEAGKAGADQGEGVSLVPEVVTAELMRKGKPVGEGWLYGVNACAMIATGLVDQGTMRAYRSGAFFARKSLYGEAAALVWEAEAKARHESARAGFRDTTTEPRHLQVPDKTAPTKEYVF